MQSHGFVLQSDLEREREREREKGREREREREREGEMEIEREREREREMERERERDGHRQKHKQKQKQKQKEPCAVSEKGVRKGRSNSEGGLDVQGDARSKGKGKGKVEKSKGKAEKRKRIATDQDDDVETYQKVVVTSTSSTTSSKGIDGKGGQSSGGSGVGTVAKAVSVTGSHPPSHPSSASSQVVIPSVMSRVYPHPSVSSSVAQLYHTPPSAETLTRCILTLLQIYKNGLTLVSIYDAATATIDCDCFSPNAVFSCLFALCSPSSSFLFRVSLVTFFRLTILTIRKTWAA